MKLYLLFTCFSLTVGSFAALPPFYQSVREIKALVTDPQLFNLLGSSEGISDISKTDSGYTVKTRSRLVKVELEYLSLGHAGPTPFQFHFSNPVPLLGEP